MILRVAELYLERLGALEVEVEIVLPGEADAAVHLYGFAAHLARRLADVGLADRGGDRGVLRPRLERPGRVVDGGVAVLHLHQHLRALVANGLEGADELPELLAHLSVAHRHVERAASRAQHLRRGAHGGPCLLYTSDAAD